MKQGLLKVKPDRRDYSLVHTFGATTAGLPDSFSIYDGRPIPNQNELDGRFVPAIRPLPYGCTAETTTFIAGLEDGATYPPDDFYFATPPGDEGGRDIRAALALAKTRGFKLHDGTLGAKKGDYYNCRGAGAIDDFDAARIGLWINQWEKRGVSVGTWWYWGGAPNNALQPQGVLATPSFDTRQAGLHNWLIVGWRDKDTLMGIPWCGDNYGDKGIVYVSRTLFNKLMAQPYTGAFTLAKTPVTGPVPVGFSVVVDHLVAFIRSLFKV